MKNVTAKSIIINLLITLVVGAVYFYIKLPAINFHNEGFYSFFFILALVFCALSAVSVGLHKVTGGMELWAGLKAHCLVPMIICAVFGLMLIGGSLVGLPIFRADAYSKLLEISDGDFAAEVDEISYDQIPMLDEDSAKRLGNRKLGELSEYVSQFEVAEDYTQINYQGRPVRVTPLVYGDIIKWFTNRADGLPAYLIIDMVTQNVEVVRLDDTGEGIKYTTAEHFGRNLTRHLRFQYPTYMFDDANFEIDEEGTPYWVSPRIVKRIGLFSGTDIRGAVLTNALTGESQYYEEVPSWVDRVYTADIIIRQYDYYGMYQSGWLNSIFGQKNVTQTTEGYNYIVNGDDVYMYTGITSVMSDESNIGFILTNQRTKETKFYPVAGAEEYSARASAEGVVQQYKYISTFPLLLNISGQPTYFMALKDDAELVKMYAMVNVQQYQIVATGTSVAECERNYIKLLSDNNLAEEEVVTTNDVSGRVDDIRSAVIDGNTHIYIRLLGDDFYYVISVADAPIAAVLNPGDEVTLSVSEGEGELISAYDIKVK
ncbi:MAG: CvpA family protein [Oscillospiraceae bacterium]|nr:CvpA family protein [Oscillospiraceae bacterium]